MPEIRFEGSKPATKADERRATDIEALLAGHGLTGKRLVLATAAARQSPFLADCLEKEAEWFAGQANISLTEMAQNILQDCEALSGREDGEQEKGLRYTRRRIALVTGLGDLSGEFDLKEVTSTLSRFAVTALSTALNGALAATISRRRLPEAAADASTNGLFILALGKLGAEELNYSSDIDLIAFYDRQRLGEDAGPGFVTALKDLTNRLSTRTADGYVARVDWRLRPDPGAMPLALSTDAAINYYQGLARNWERLAFIKAHAVAGDVEAGTAFLEELTPFIWRRSLDYSLVAEMREIVARIKAKYDQDDRDIEGWNVKTGPGGIREIEFFAQVQQVIGGGRDRRLRHRDTIGALGALKSAGLVSETDHNKLVVAYRFLRTLEHRIQMIDDEQTHTIPDNDDQRKRLASLMGMTSMAKLAAQSQSHRDAVQSIFHTLFAEDDEVPQTFFPPGQDDDSSLAADLKERGFAEPERSAAILQVWSTARYPALRSQDAQKILWPLLPRLLEELSRRPQPDIGLANLDHLLEALPSSLQFLSMLSARPKLLDLLIELCCDAPALLDVVRKDPAVLGSMLEPDFWTLPDAGEQLRSRLDRYLPRQADLQGAMDVVRLFNRIEGFRLAVQILRGGLDAKAAGRGFADLTDVAVQHLLDATTAEFVKPGQEEPKLVVMALGRYGSREMSLASDLDLIVISDDDADLQIAGRAARRLINALSAPTAEGIVREVDLRLRPSGRSGPLVTTLQAFIRHHRKAETWELLALSRARTVAGPEALRHLADEALCEVLCQDRDPAKTAADTLAMRRLIEKERKPKGPLDVKLMRGGLFDVEFTAQLLTLVHAAATPEIVGLDPASVFSLAADRGWLSVEDCVHLMEAHKAYSEIIQITAVASTEEDTPSLRERLQAILDIEEGNTVKKILARHGELCRKIFNATVKSVRKP